MIVAEDGDRLHLVTQCDHAHLAGELLSLWRPLAHLPHRDVLLRATRRHDDGWQGVDAAPPVDAAGRPHDFLSLPWELRLEIWDRGTAAFEHEPEVALLIVEHALSLHRDSIDDPRIGVLARRLVELLGQRREALRERLGPRASEISALYPWLRAADLLSLVATNRWSNGERRCALPGERSPLRTRWFDRALHLDPFPLAGPTTIHYAERMIPNRSYRDLSDLGGELAHAAWRSEPVSVRPWTNG